MKKPNQLPALSHDEAMSINVNQVAIRDGLDRFDTVAKKHESDEQAAALVVAKEAAYKSVLDLTEQGAVLDGPTLNKAGLGFENRAKLGYHGSTDTLVADANVWKQKTDEEARRDAYHEKNASKAAAWQAETKEFRDAREQANTTVEKMMDGTHATENLTYKQRLELGGTIGVKKLEGQLSLSREDAIAAAETKGENVAHLKPRHYEVVRRPAAEKRAAEMAGLLAAQRAVTKAPEATKESEKPLTVKEMSKEQRDELFQNLRDASKNRVAVTKGEASRDKPAFFAGLKGKWETLTGRGKKRVAAAVLVGVALVGSALAINGDENGSIERPSNEVSSDVNGGNANDSNRAEHNVDQNNRSKDRIEQRNHTAGATQAVYEVVEGDTVWDISNAALPNNASVERIDELKDAILTSSNKTEKWAQTMPIGTELQIPQQILDEQLKNAK